ncbi:2-keto-4-pentenoate hydratase/2-oxohepta-3-ene-1,7-dioic acid hydratase (catechol pathway) [Nocardioides terrae]|uniref:2-keto-4-pentenoate hydratase/2-oxohepta-3-ene-1,7-dioic acid hydratase (Catechol pathway) n=1 Tax=Nocardioides terrae TaxID=574651 RepID=A0A1I1IY49_9ACTN|nr:fumarylacetoacetate hydrolase family protein [Nocardioides terrae]SFC41174.1 2-keto-4-pentenoate hydratase/2-oxohepta-3-ene-1,7-dioic acid hydratase (catechol pathway) [Nocardioides terrae]
MRIARFTTGGDPQYGVIAGELDQFGQPEEDAQILVLAGDPLYVGLKPSDQAVAFKDAKLLAPVIPRSKVVAIGKNYADHVAEMKGVTGGEAPEEPLFFLKPNTSVIGPGDAIVYPPQTENLHFEGELAVVIGRICKDVPAEKAADVIFGYTLANDVSARDLQVKDKQWSRAKGFDTFCPLGPWIETELTLDEIKAGIDLKTYLQGDLKQDGSTADLIFDIPRIIAHVSAAMTLLPGDVILTGTPAGVGPMEPGDEVEVASPRLGALTNPVTKKS